MSETTFDHDSGRKCGRNVEYVVFEMTKRRLGQSHAVTNTRHLPSMRKVRSIKDFVDLCYRSSGVSIRRARQVRKESILRYQPSDE